MFKRLLQFSSHIEEAASNGADHNVSGAHTPAATALPVAHEVEEVHSRETASTSTAVPEAKVAPAKFAPFSEIYRNSHFKQPTIAYDILKVAEMLDSQHLKGLSLEAKRCAVLMALEVAGAEVGDLLQDAMARQRALNDYEESQTKNLKEFENAKNRENSEIQAELERVTARYMARIQSNVDLVAREQDNFRAWQQEKQRELQSIAEAAAFCAPQNSGSTTGNLSAMLARCGVEAVAGNRT